MSSSVQRKASKSSAKRRPKRSRSHMPEARETTSPPDHELRKVARRKLREAKALPNEPELFPLPELGPVRPGNRCLAEIADLEERFAAGELTWHDYSQRLRELAPRADA